MTTHDARALALAWLSVGIASGVDNGRPVLDRTIHVERHAGGLTLAATDGLVLLRAWVPPVDHDLELEPGTDNAPDEVAVVGDRDSRARSLLAYARKLTADDDYKPGDLEARVTLNAGDRNATDRLAGLAPTFATIDLPDTERVWLPRIDVDYPNWRRLLAGFAGRRTTAIALNTDVVGRLAKLGDLLHCPLVWHFGGADAMALVECGPEPSTGVHVTGAAMPVRFAGLADLDPAEQPRRHAGTPAAGDDLTIQP